MSRIYMDEQILILFINPNKYRITESIQLQCIKQKISQIKNQASMA